MNKVTAHDAILLLLTIFVLALAHNEFGVF